MSFLSVQYDTPILSPGFKNVQKYRIQQNQITYFDFPWINISLVSLISNLSSDHLFTYTIESLSSSIDIDPQDQSIFDVDFLQAKKQNHILWTRITLDVLLGLVGGVTSILWSAFGKIIAPYQNFESQAQLIRGIYPTQPKINVEKEVSSREEAHEALVGTVIERDRFSYSFCEFFTTQLFKTFLCFCICKSSNFWKQRLFKYDRYKKA